MFPFFFGSTASSDEASKLPLFFHNTLTGKKERFTPIRSDHVGMYNCGPTVYDYVTIGNWRAYIFADTLRRVLEYNDFEVRQAMNITDVGHLISDADAGEDKMTLALTREGKPKTLEAMKEIADFYTDAFMQEMSTLNIRRPQVMPQASEHVEAMKALIATLMEKEYAYQTSDGVYFDVARFPDYGKLGNIKLQGQKEGARVEENPEKRSPYDFALWKRNDELGWEAPWGRGFPGWHIECSAMSMQYLGKQFDIHTGGIDHIPIHHNNEIAQSEAATGRQYVRFWLHNAFLNIEGTKISKSLGNTIKLRQLIEHGYDPLAYRYWLLTAHYKTPVNFTWNALDAAAQAYTRLERYFVETLLPLKGGEIDIAYRRRFHEAINDDLDTPKAIAIMWELIKDKDIEEKNKKATLLDFDRVLGLGLIQDKKKLRAQTHIRVVALKDLPEETRLLVIAREEMREKKDWAKADELRDEIKKQGYLVEDVSEGPKVTRA